MFKELNNLKPFLKKPRAEYGVREFARLQQIAPATASKFMEGFAKKKVLKKERYESIISTKQIVLRRCTEK
ncbi:MAG: hypothetical protein U5Q03_12130 [Bacteroidota bacterium]|nr:hypothetical protein [Bacteroidota bacterium]